MVNTDSGKRKVAALRSCGRCRYAYFGEAGIYCVAFGEFVDDEIRAAADCPLYEQAQR